jgi:hypothetical protein
VFLKREIGAYLGYPILSTRGHKAPHLHTRVPGILSHVSECVPTRFGLVDARLSSQGAHPGLLIMAQRDLSLNMVVHCVAGQTHVPAGHLCSRNQDTYCTVMT